MRGTRRPSSSCCPSRHEIWEKLTTEPLAPVMVISAIMLWRKGRAWPPGRQALTTSEDSGCMAPDIFMSSATPASLLPDRKRSPRAERAARSRAAKASSGVAPRASSSPGPGVPAKAAAASSARTSAPASSAARAASAAPTSRTSAMPQVKPCCWR
jgi:hypothetical protein